MEIIKRGLIPKEAIWRGTCINCKSEVRAKGSELDNIKYDQRQNGYYCWHKCPVCHRGDSNYGGICFHIESKL